jgi:hypothetical protein
VGPAGDDHHRDRGALTRLLPVVGAYPTASSLGRLRPRLCGVSIDLRGAVTAGARAAGHRSVRPPRGAAVWRRRWRRRQSPTHPSSAGRSRPGPRAYGQRAAGRRRSTRSQGRWRARRRRAWRLRRRPPRKPITWCPRRGSGASSKTSCAMVLKALITRARGRSAASRSAREGPTAASRLGIGPLFGLTRILPSSAPTSSMTRAAGCRTAKGSNYQTRGLHKAPLSKGGSQAARRQVRSTSIRLHFVTFSQC